MRIQHEDHNRTTLEVDHYFSKVKHLLSNTRLFITRFHRFGNSSYFIIHQHHNFLPILGLILLKLKHASNTPVYFRDFCTAYSALPQKSSRITFQHMYANLLRSKITHVKFTKGGNITTIFSSEKFTETNNIFAIRCKKTLPVLIACVQTTHARNRCHKAIK